MLKKIFIFCLLFFISGVSVFAVSDKVENIFSDIDSDYKYLSELQELYDKGIIQPDASGKFNPYKLLTREEFVGILMETNCNKCIKPNTSYNLIDKYINKNVYYDVNNASDYFYCVAEADDKNYVRGYEVGSTCENGVTKKGEKPFCPNNTIILEEALAVVMRAGNILSQDEANRVLQSINNSSYPDLSNDVKTTNIDGSIYSFYPYFQKAETFIITDYNIYGDKIQYSLINKTGDNYYPKKSINREDFLQIALFALKNSSCIQEENTDISAKISILESACSQSSNNCNYEYNYNTDSIIDLDATAVSQCILGVPEPDGYSWIINNISQNTETIYKGKYIDNYIFPNNGNYNIRLEVKDNCQNTTNISKNISVMGDNKIQISAGINRLIIKNNSVEFKSIVTGNNGPYTYLWDFGDGNTSTNRNQIHQYNNDGSYDITLKITDKDGNITLVTKTVDLNQNDFNTNILTQGINNSNGEFDFQGITIGGVGPFIYSWNFGDGNTSNQKNPNHIYTKDGTYTVIFTTIDANGITRVATTSIVVIGKSQKEFNIQVSADPINGGIPLISEFQVSVTGDSGPYTYLWNFGDGTTGVGKNISHTFTEIGTYTVSVIVTDAQGNTKIEYLTIIVNNGGNLDNNGNENIDSDKDGVTDNLDKCPNIPGKTENQGCPIFTKKTPPKVSNSCNYSNSSTIFGNTVGCSNTLDFNAQIRGCDVVFPAITSPDGTEIYSRGNYFQIKK